MTGLLRTGTLALLTALALTAPARALKLELPLQRSAYQVGERVPVAVVRQAADAPLRELTVEVTGADGFAARFSFDPHAQLEPHTPPRGTEYLLLDAGALRPGRYTISVRTADEQATQALDITDGVRATTYRLINWGTPSSPEGRLAQGRTGLGYNLMYVARGALSDPAGDFLRAGVELMPVCALGGGHQIDLRLDVDWSDPLGLQGGSRRAAREALIHRLRPEALGVHLYDEPGLTWGNHPQTGEFLPHGVAAQDRAYAGAFKQQRPAYHLLDPDNPAQVASWRHFGRWKLAFMDAAWRQFQNAVQDVDPRLLTVTQSQYGWTAFTDGYYFNIARSLPVTSGHGGYHDIHFGYFTPVYFLEMARARDRRQPNWYLPTWYQDTTDDLMRLENNLCFQVGIQGIMTPPPLEPTTQPRSPVQGIVESNQLFARLGTLFHTPRPAREDVALLFSLSDCLHQQTRDPRQANYLDKTRHGRALQFAYLTLKALGYPLSAIVEEDVLDGSLAARHRAVIVGGVDHLDPAVAAALTQFAQGGGLVLTFDCGMPLDGAQDLQTATPQLPDFGSPAWEALIKSGKYAELSQYQTVPKYLQGAAQLRTTLAAALSAGNLLPPLQIDGGLLSVTRHELGEVEYLLAVNATPTPGAADKLAVTPVTVRLALPADERPLYDAVAGALATGWQREGDQWRAELRLGAGQMLVLARPRAAIGQVAVGTPELLILPEQVHQPRTLRLSAAVLDEQQRLIAGTIPLRVQVIGSDGAVRYDLYRAADAGVLQLELPLALNDPAGDWTIVVQELLGGHEGRADLSLPVVNRAGLLAGLEPRAYSLPADRDRIERFAQRHRVVYLVPADIPLAQAAAERLRELLAPWQLRAEILPLAQAKQTRLLSAAEAATWIGLNHTGKGSIKPDEPNSPLQVGYQLPGPTILIGDVKSHDLIAFLAQLQVLPFSAAAAGLPGVGRGALAWQRDVLAPGVESIALIAHDPAGYDEAVGTLYELISGLRPVSAVLTAQQHDLTPPTPTAVVASAPQPVLLTRLPDRVVHVSAQGQQLTAVSADGTQMRLVGKAMPRVEVLDSAAVAQLAPGLPPLDPQLGRDRPALGRWVKAVLTQDQARSAVLNWGGSLILTGAGAAAPQTVQMPGEVSAAAWVDADLLLGLADGRVYRLAW